MRLLPSQQRLRLAAIMTKILSGKSTAVRNPYNHQVWVFVMEDGRIFMREDTSPSEWREISQADMATWLIKRKDWL